MFSLWTWAHVGAVAAQLIALGAPGPHSTTAPAAASGRSAAAPAGTAGADRPQPTAPAAAHDSQPNPSRQANPSQPANSGREADSPSRTVALMRLAPAGSDKAVHASLFAAATFTGIYAGIRPGVVIATQLALAPATEVAQETFIPRRGGSVKDVAADVVGITLGALAALFLRRR